MEIGSQILFFLAGLGVFNGFLLALYLFFFVRPRRWVNFLFGLLMLMLCIRIGKSLFFIFTDVARIYRQIGLSACIMVGPFLYLYIKHFLNKIKTPKNVDWVHILIPLFSIILIGFLRPYEAYPEFWNNFMVLSIYGVWSIYMIGTFFLVFPLIRKGIKKQISFKEGWILLIYSCILILCIAYILAYYGFPYLSGPLLFSLIFYVLIAFLANKKSRMLIMYDEPVKYQNQKISEKKAEDLINRLSGIMQNEHFYLNPKIKLAQIAQSIDSTPHELSQVINNRLGISFNHYINEFRIKAACRMLQEYDHLTIEGIGREVGFNSRTAFYAAFKTMMNQTPAQYKMQLKKSLQ